MPPADAEIAAEIAAVGALADVPRPDAGWETLDDDVLDAYLARTDAVLDRRLPAHRPHRLHGDARRRQGRPPRRLRPGRASPSPVLVAEQAEPDPDFPTVAFPNPEEPGAMDLAFATARRGRTRT